MKQKLAKKIFVSVLVFAMTIGTFTQYVTPAREVQAETSDEPVYNATSDVLTYSQDTSKLSPSVQEMWLGTKVLPPTETYYVSFHVKADELQNGGFVQIRFYGKAGMAYLSLYNSQYYLSNHFKEGDKYIQGNKGLKDGVTITYAQGPDGISIWMNGVKEQTNLKPTSTETMFAPKIHIEKGNFTLTNIKIWTTSDVPQFDENNHILKYSIDAVDKTNGNGDYPLAPNPLPTTEASYVSFDLSVSNLDAAEGTRIKFFGKMSMACLELYEDKYVLAHFKDGNGTINYATGLERGVRITYSQGPDGITVWLNGAKVKENLAPDSTSNPLIPAITPINSATVQLTNIKIWTDKGAPQYDEKLHILKFSDSEKNIASGNDYFFGTEPFSTEETSYVSFYIKTSNAASTGSVTIKFYGKGSMAQLVLYKDKYVLSHFKDGNGTINYATGLEEGVKITYSQGPKGITVWMNDIKVQANLIPESTAGALKPGLAIWIPVSLNEVKVWTEKAKGPTISDEPVYDAAKHSLTYDKDASTIAANGELSFGTPLPTAETYYVSFEVQTEDSLNLDFYGKGGMARLWFLQSQYVLVNFKGGEQYINGNKGLANGVRITYSQGPEGISVWINGEKAHENLQPVATENGNAPRVRAGSKSVDVKNVKVWAAKKQEPEEPIVSDAPVYNPEKHVLYEITGSKGGTYQDGVLTVQPQSSGYFNTDLDANADYYMSLIVKAKNPVNLSYRTKGQINIQSSGYESIGTAGKWVNKNFSKLPTGLPVTIHSTPDWITIWVNGEKILDEAYTTPMKGECRPGISWSFNEEVTVSDVKIWTEPVENRNDLGEISMASKSPLFVVKEYGVALREEAQKKAYVDASPVGVNAQKSVVKGSDGQSEIIASDIKTQGTRMNLMKASIPIAGVLVMLVIIIVQIVKRKKMQ